MWFLDAEDELSLNLVESGIMMSGMTPERPTRIEPINDPIHGFQSEDSTITSMIFGRFYSFF